MVDVDLLSAKKFNGHTLGPLNHLWASITYQRKASVIGPPYTTHVQFMSMAGGFAVLVLFDKMGNVRREAEYGQHN
jgi:hypothetical protein